MKRNPLEGSGSSERGVMTSMRVARDAPKRSRRCVTPKWVLRAVGLLSSMVALPLAGLPFDLSVGEWNPIIFSLYLLCCCIFYFFVLSVEPSFSIQTKICSCFVVFIILACSFFYDGRLLDGLGPDFVEALFILSMVRNVAFALLSLSLAKLADFGFETVTFCYFLGYFTIQLLTINWMLIFVAIFVDFPLILIFLNIEADEESMFQTLLRVYQGEKRWRLVGLLSSLVGLPCHALSPSFNRLIRGWNPFKFFLYGVLSLIICSIILFAKHYSLPTFYVRLKTYMCFAVLMIISVYSYLYDRAVNGKPEILSLVANASFALVSLSLSKLFMFGFEMGMFSYFLTCLTVQMLTINWKLILVAILSSVVHSLLCIPLLHNPD